MPTNVPGAAAVNNFVRWVSGSVVPEGGLGGPAMQPSMSWAPIGQVALDRGAFDAALGLGSSSSSDNQAAQIRIEGTFRQFKEDVKEEALQEQGVMASSVVVTTGFSIGYVLWLARGGALLASLASAIPAWTSMDPLPVLSNYKGRGKGPGGEDLDDPAEKDGMPGSRKDNVEDMFRSRERSGRAPAVAEARPQPSAPAPESPAPAPAPAEKRSPAVQP